YSNLIEGHDTHPIDIERALNDDFSSDARTRNLQKEARAHIEVQGWIDTGTLAGRSARTSTTVEIHARFCRLLPDDLLWVEDLESKERVQFAPGALRDRDVRVGRHVAVSPGAVPRFLKHFESAYGTLGKSEHILATAAAHHRLLWIHPFLDGNGRVARLMSHAMLLESLDSGGLWSVARGLARNEATYKSHLANCDLDRRNDLDGRGTLSEEALADFTQFFLETCLDQVRFMESLMQPSELRYRILQWAEEMIRARHLPAKATSVLEAVLYRGELPRGDVPGLLDCSERQARRVVSALFERDVLSAASSKAPLRLNFPAYLAPRWTPGLFPPHTAARND
ncbi:MAG: Fic family protein, partial [Gammaproteobacteria bacterium]|nr:Fic family protein [Gammaproteobacteria bacterium]